MEDSQVNEKQKIKLKDFKEHKVRTRVYSPFTLIVVGENVFCQGMVVLLNPVVFYFLECFTFIRAKYVLQFNSRPDHLQNLTS